MSESTTPVHTGLASLNSLPEPEIRDLLASCLAVPRWVDEVTEARPYRDVAALRDQARASAENLTDDELATALAGHPRIGEQPNPAAARDPEAAFSRQEQAGVASDDADLARRLRAANEAYEECFDRVFLIRATGRSGDEILAELERRLANDATTERRETIAQLREIALSRLDQAVGH